MPTTPNVENVKLGACSVIWGTDDLGYTKGGCDVSITTSTKEINVDQFGETAIDEYIQGRMVEVTVPMAESDLDKLVLAIPGAVLVEDGTTPSKKKIEVSTSVGTSLRANAKKLVLHPINGGSNKNDDFVVLLASPNGTMEFSYQFDNERVYNVTFKGYPHATTGALYVFGDESAAD